MNDISNLVKIAVTGAGSELACSIIKACRKFKISAHITGCDITQNAVGRYFCDDFIIVPPAASTEYIHALGTMVQQKGIQVIIPTSDAEIPVLAKNRNLFYDQYGCKILVNTYREYERFNDKWNSYNYFKKKSIPTAITFNVCKDLSILDSAIKVLDFPMIIKPCSGGGSRHIFKAMTRDDVLKYIECVPDPLLQEYIPSDQGEYTAGTYRDKNNSVHVIVLKRTLKFGMTNIAQSVINRPDFEGFCRNVILKTRLEGSNNIQFRISRDGPKVIEINPRFSGTTGIRSLCGFNDVEMWVTEVLKIGDVKSVTIKKKKFFRYMEEIEDNSK